MTDGTNDEVTQDHQVAKAAVKGPAIGLIISGAIGILLTIGAMGFMSVLPKMIEEMEKEIERQRPELSEEEVEQQEQALESLRDTRESLESTGNASFIIGLVLSLLLIIGAVKMMGGKGLGWAYVACILGILNCCPGIIFGIWGLVTLNKPEVKALFSASS